MPDLLLAGVVILIVRELPDLDGAMEHRILVTLSAASTAVLMVAVGRYRVTRAVWLRLAASAAGLTVHHGCFLWFIPTGHEATPPVRTAIVGGAAASALFAGWAVVLIARPLLSYAPTRRPVRWAIPVGMIGASSIPLADPVLYDDGPSLLHSLALVLPIGTCAAIVVFGAVVAGPLLRAGRTFELRVIAAYLALISLTVVAFVVNYYRYWAVPGVVAMVIVAAASMSPSAAWAGQAVDSRPVITKVSYRWGALAALPIALLIPAVQLGAPPDVAFACFGLTTVIYIRFLRDMGRGSPVPVDKPSERAVALAHALPGAIVHEHLVLHYQPIVRLHDGVVMGFESLLRWSTPELGTVAPEEIVVAAARSGLGAELDAHVIERVSRQLPSLLHRLAADEPYLAVNVCPATLQQPGFAAGLLRRLAALGATVDGLLIEIIELGEIRDWDVLRDNVARLQDAGALIALDDFGTGTSNLQYLSEISADVVKLDRTLVAWAMNGGRGVVGRVIELARASGVSIVAEGVEDAEAVKVMKELGVDFVQGYYFGRPTPLAGALALLPRPATVAASPFEADLSGRPAPLPDRPAHPTEEYAPAFLDAMT